MGGLALKNCVTRRYNKDEFEKIIPEILEKARLIFPDAVSTQAYRNKESFGDADILCLWDGKPHNLKEWIRTTFDSKEVVQNTTVYSFEYKELQVDFILTPQENWESAQTYFSFNDIHNLIGKLFHSVGLKWGQDGLRYVYRIDGKVLGEISLTTNYNEAFQLVGLDPKVYTNGFDDLVDMFKYVVTSHFFNPVKYDLENLNRINRERDKKRKTYAAFIDYIEPLRQNEFKYLYPDKKVYLGLIDHYFPGFLKKYRDLELIEERKRKIHSLYNGNLIIERYGIQGKDLGKAMTEFVNEFFATRGTTDYQLFENWLLDLDDSDKILHHFGYVNKLTPL